MAAINSDIYDVTVGTSPPLGNEEKAGKFGIRER